MRRTRSGHRLVSLCSWRGGSFPIPAAAAAGHPELSPGALDAGAAPAELFPEEREKGSAGPAGCEGVIMLAGQASGRHSGLWILERPLREAVPRVSHGPRWSGHRAAGPARSPSASRPRARSLG
eukprot:2356968-Lingulodinium_polyedra.AAC.1